MTDSSPRKLAVIVHADVIGSTILVQKNETLAHERIVNAFKLFSETIATYSGITHEIRGDALLAEFARASDAVSAVLEFQNNYSSDLEKLDDDICPKMRVGIAMGEVIIADDTMTGAGVVMAQRLEQLAEAGGVVIQGAAYETIPKHLPFRYQSIGDQKLKGFDEAVRAYRVSDKGFTAAARFTPRRRFIFGMAITAVIIFVIALLWFQPPQSSALPPTDSTPGPTLPDKPSIAVLPFDNMSNDAEQEYFVDGLTEDLITDLSKLSGLFVIARNSVFTYKDKATNVTQVAKELGVRYVLEGSVRRSGDQVRINAQLIDATTGAHLWADRFDGLLTDVFAMQDQVNLQIITALSIELNSTEEADWRLNETDSSEAYNAYLKGWEHYQRQTPENHAIARDFLKQSLDIDPNYNRALATLAALYWEVHSRSWGPALKESEFTLYDTALAYLDRALRNPTTLALVIESRIHIRHGRHEEGIATAKRALKLSSNDADAHLALARALILSGRAAESHQSIDLAERLDPFGEAQQQFFRGLAEFGMQNYTAAKKSFVRSYELNSNYVLAMAALTATYGHLKQKKDAQAAWQSFVDSETTEYFTHNLLSILSYFPYKKKIDSERMAKGLRLAGVPETYGGWEVQESAQ